MKPEEIEALAASVAPIVAAKVAREVADRVLQRQEREFVNAFDLARALGVEREWVYEHQEQLGAIRLGNGQKPRLRFDLARALAAFETLPTSDRRMLASGPGQPSVPRPRQTRRRSR